jgi:hypothetical protein
MSSVQAHPSAYTKHAGHTGPPSTAIQHAVQKSPMLLHVLRETKKESYFTGLQDPGAAYRGSDVSKL